MTRVKQKRQRYEDKERVVIETEGAGKSNDRDVIRAEWGSQ